MAANFDFVVGHVNVASYLDELNLDGCHSHQTCMFLEDKYHPNKFERLLNLSPEHVICAVTSSDTYRSKVDLRILMLPSIVVQSMKSSKLELVMKLSSKPLHARNKQTTNGIPENEQATFHNN